MLQSDIFYVGSGIDRVKYGTRIRIWRKTVWLYALWMKTQLIFLARRLFFSQEAADLSPDFLKGLNKSLLAFFPFYLTHSILLIRWLSKSLREKMI